MTDLNLLSLGRRVDRLLAPWSGPDSPGCTIGVVRGGALVLHRSAGLASIELGHPIGPETSFRVASVTKQFTCAAILMLAQDGKLDLDDDIRRYLPELPALDERVTVAQLMHNSSGLRDMLEIMRLGGTDLPQPCSAAALLAGICRQRGLNFPPGTRFLYSNSNFLLLGLIVERIAGESFAGFLDSRIFTPLGMTRSRLVESAAEVVPGLATGYLPKPGGGWLRAQHGFALGGEGGLVSSVEDLALWAHNFIGGPALAAALEQQAHFRNGRLNSYARGLQVKSYRGFRTVDHGGLWPGFKTEFLRVPARELAVICIANDATADPYHLAHQVVDAALEGDPQLLSALALPPPPDLARLIGRYVDATEGLTLELSLAEDGTPIGTMHGVPFALVATADGRLAARRGAFDLTLSLDGDGHVLEVELDAGHRARFERVTGSAALPADLAGRYASAEIAASWTITLRDGRLTLEVDGPLAKAGPWPIEAIAGDIIRVTLPGTLFNSWLDVRLQRDGRGRIDGLLLNSGRIRGLIFKRATTPE